MGCQGPGCDGGDAGREHGCVLLGDPAGHQDGGQFLGTGDDERGCDGGDGHLDSLRNHFAVAAVGHVEAAGAHGLWPQSGLPLRPPASDSESVGQSAAGNRHWASSTAPLGCFSVPLG